MLNISKTNKKTHTERNLRRERRLWHHSKENMASLGCIACPDYKTCGGLHVNHTFFDCFDYCCGNPNSCDTVCRRNPAYFVRRIREIAGFDLNNIPRSKSIIVPPLPSVVPVLYHGNRRIKNFNPSMVCLSLFEITSRRNGLSKYKDKKELAEAFRIDKMTPVILTGIEKDHPLERWWGLGSNKRLDGIRSLQELGIELITTPNYSLFTDQPRWDDMHSIKRIATTYEEFMRIGIPAALHLNARTEKDWERWAEFIEARREITHVSFEFTTGSGWPGRINWHTNHLINLAKNVSRPLNLVVRGGKNILAKLIESFNHVTYLDTSTFIKTAHRQSAYLSTDGNIKWKSIQTPGDAPLDNLLAHNWSITEKLNAHMLLNSH